MYNNCQKKRIYWIDVLKGLSMILVITGHRMWSEYGIVPAIIKIWIYSFHMPLFFFLSGYTFSVDKYASFKIFLMKKIKTIVIPMVFFSLVTIIFRYVYYSWLLNNESRNIGKLFRSLIGIIYQGRKSNYNGCFWFLACLFIAEIMMYWIVKITKNRMYKKLIIALFAYVIGVWWIMTTNILLPWCIEIAIVALLFLVIGNISKVFVDYIGGKLSFAVVFTIIHLLSAYSNWLMSGKIHIDLAADIIGNPVLFAISGLSGIYACVSVFYKLKGIKCVKYIGVNSLIYYGLSDLMFFVPEILIYNILNLNIARLGNWSFLVGIMMMVIVCITIYPLSVFINKKIPYVVGK